MGASRHSLGPERDGRAWRSLAAVGALVLLLASPSARADVVGPAPDDCPAGTTGSSSHCGAKCVPVSCDADTPCEAGTSCAELALCVVSRSCVTYGGPYDDSTIEGPCGDGDSCANGTCEVRSVCVEPDPGGDPVLVEQGCGCSQPGLARPAAGLFAFGLAALGVAIGRRRRG